MNLCNCNDNCVGRHAPVHNYYFSSNEAIPKWVLENNIDPLRVKVSYSENIEGDNIVSCQSQRYFLMKNGNILANKESLVSYFRQIMIDGPNIKKIISDFEHQQKLLSIRYLGLIEQTLENCKPYYEDRNMIKEKNHFRGEVRSSKTKKYLTVFDTVIPEPINKTFFERSK